MKTDIIKVSANGNRMESALAEVEKVAEYKGLSPKDTLHLRLLTEEMMGMMRSITGAEEGEFWIEDEDGEYRLHLRVMSRLNTEKKEQLLSVSSSGKNEGARGLMGKLRTLFDWSGDDDLAFASSSLMMPEMYEHSSSPTLNWEWTMSRYESALSNRVGQNDSAAREAWDELEKSVVAHVADEVKVSFRSGIVEMIIYKKMAG